MKRALAILLLANSLFADTRAFDVTGQVLGIARGTQGWILLASDAKPNNFAIRDGSLPDCRSGDIVRAFGITQANKHGNAYSYATNVVRLGKRPLPETVEIDGRQINDADMLHRCVRLRGIVSAVKRDDTNAAWNQITLRTPTGKVCAVVQDDACPFERLSALVDAEVTLAGYVTRFGAMLRFLGCELGLFDENGVVAVHRRAPDDPFAAPPLTSPRILRRQRAEGIVIAADRHRIYLKTPRMEFLPVLMSTDAPPPVGARVTAAGYAEPDLRGLQLADARVRVEPGPPAPVVQAKDLVAETLFTGEHGNAIARSQYYGKPIRLKGKVVNTPDNIRHARELQLASGRRVITVDVSRIGGARDPASLADCEVAVAGYCLPRFERDAASSWIPRFEGFALVPRTSDDITVLARPSWWTPTKLLCVIGALLVLIAAILVWNQTLRVMSERRGARLARERIKHAKSELKVEERTRLAVELHDSISQTLTGVALQVDAAVTANAGANPAVERPLAISRQMLASCRKELQCCLWDLRSRTFEEKDMNEAIHRSIGPQAGNAKVAVRFNVSRDRLSETAVQAILRIVCELVANAVRHGGATEIRVAGESHDNTIRLSVRDNGSGFDPARAPGPGALRPARNPRAALGLRRHA